MPLAFSPKLVIPLTAVIACLGAGCSENTAAIDECASDEECPPGKRICAAVSGSRRCVECLRHSDCSEGQQCGPDRICGTCADDADCPAERPHCFEGDCRECVVDAHCTGSSANLCVDHRCQGCTEQCPGSLTCSYSELAGNVCAAVCDRNESCPESYPVCVESMLYVRQCCRAGGHPCVSCRSDADCMNPGERCLEDPVLGGISCR